MPAQNPTGKFDRRRFRRPVQHHAAEDASPRPRRCHRQAPHDSAAARERAELTVSGRGGGGSGLPISYTLSGPGDVIHRGGQIGCLHTFDPGTVNVQTGAENEAPHLNVKIDPARAAVLGVSPGAAATVARTAVGGVIRPRCGLERPGQRAASISADGAQFDRSDPTYPGPRQRRHDGAPGRVATFTFDRAPIKIEHVDKAVVVRVNGDIDRTKTTLGEVIGRVNKELATPGFLPAGVTLGTDGDSKYFLEFLARWDSPADLDRADLLASWSSCTVRS